MTPAFLAGLTGRSGTRRAVLALLVGVCVSGTALAHDFKAGALRIDHPHATPTLPGMRTGAVYFHGIRNTGVTPDRLLSASTPLAERVEIHRMAMQGDVMQMREVPTLDLPANSTVVLRPGGTEGQHLMLLGLVKPLQVGDRFELTLVFEQAGTQQVKVWVEAPAPREPDSPVAAPHHH